MKVTLGNNKITLMQVEDSKTKIKGIGLVSIDRFNTFTENNERPNIEHIKSLDEDLDTIISFSNLHGLEALISELEIIKLSMQLSILNSKKQGK